MKILIFSLDINCKDYDCKFVYDDENFYNEILFKSYDVLIINFDFLSSFLEVNQFFKGVVIFVGGYLDETIYKKVLEKGDWFYTFDEIWKIPFRLKYISTKILNQKDIFIYNDLIFNVKTKELYKNRENIKLTPSEKEVLKILIKYKNRFISKEEIVEKSENLDNISSVKVIISKIRKVGFEIANQKKLGYKIKEYK